MSAPSPPHGARRLGGHSPSPEGLSWSPTGELLASGSFDRSVRIWDVANGNTIKTLGSFGGGVKVVSWSPDGQYLATASNELGRPLRVWDTTTWRSVFEVDPALGEPNDASISGIDWAPNSKEFAIALGGTTMKGNDVYSWVKVYSVPDWQNARTLTYDGVGYLKWSPDGKRIAFGAVAPEFPADSFIAIWYVDATGANEPGDTKRLDVISNIGTTIEWSPDSKSIAVGSTSNDIYVQDVATGDTIQTLKGHTMTVESVDWSPDGKQLVSGASDSELRIWDVESGTSKAVIEYPFIVQSVAWSPDGKSIAIGCADGNVYIQAVDQITTAP